MTQKLAPENSVERTNQLLEQSCYHLARIDRAMKFLVERNAFPTRNAHDYTPSYELENRVPDEERRIQLHVEQIMSGRAPQSL